MSTLTQFFGTSTPLGTLSYFPSGYMGTNTDFTYNGSEYLATGVFKAYNSSYAGFLQQCPGAGYLLAPQILAGYQQSYPIALMYAGTTYYQVQAESSSGAYVMAWCSSLTGTYSTSGMIYSTNATLLDATIFGSLVISTGININGSGDYETYYTNGANMYSGTVLNNPPATYGIIQYMAANSAGTLAIGIGASLSASSEYGCFTTTNGYSWTNATSDTTISNVTAVCWSPVANAFILVGGSTTPVIYTTTNGYNFTSRTFPSGITALPYLSSPAQMTGYFYTASSSTSTLISTGTGKLIRATSATAYTTVDLTSYFGTTTRPIISYDSSSSTYFASTSGALLYSTDDGVTWNQQVYSWTETATASASNFGGPTHPYAVHYIGGTRVGTFTYNSGGYNQYNFYNIGTKYLTSTTPDYIGTRYPNNVYGGSGVNTTLALGYLKVI